MVCQQLFENIIEKGTFEGSIDIQKQLVADYKEDIRKYADGMDQTRITNVFNHIPVQLQKTIKNSKSQKLHPMLDLEIIVDVLSG